MNETDPRPPLEVLLVEDDLSDVRLAQEAFKAAGVRNHLSVVENGVEAMEFLRRHTKYASAPSPDLILLDLKLPLKQGDEVLAEIKADPILRLIPVVVFTLSDSEKDTAEAYQLHANCYVTKPADFEQFAAAIRIIEHFWQNVAQLPSRLRIS